MFDSTHPPSSSSPWTMRGQILYGSDKHPHIDHFGSYWLSQTCNNSLVSSVSSSPLLPSFSDIEKADLPRFPLSSSSPVWDKSEILEVRSLRYWLRKDWESHRFLDESDWAFLLYSSSSCALAGSNQSKESHFAWCSYEKRASILWS